MRKWDQTTLAVNCGAAIESHFSAIENLLGPYARRKNNKSATATDKLLGQVHEHARQMNAIADVVVGAASSRYPIHNTQPWMFEGAEPSVAHPFQEGLRREWLIVAALTELRSRLRQAVGALRLVAHEMPSREPDEGFRRIALEQWIGSIDIVSEVFTGLKSVMFGGPMDKLDWRELNLMEMIPEPTRSEIQMRLEARFDEEPAKDLGIAANDTDKMQAIVNLTESAQISADKAAGIMRSRINSERVDHELKMAARAEERAQRELRDAQEHFDSEHQAVEDDTQESDTQKPPSRAILKGRRIAEQRELRRRAREEKKAAKKLKAENRAAITPPF